mgnify:CR=1
MPDIEFSGNVTLETLRKEAPAVSISPTNNMK